MDTWQIILAFLTIVLAAYYYGIRRLSLFKKYGIPHIPPNPIFGNAASILLRQKSIAIWTQDMYNIDSGAKYVGIYGLPSPIIMIRDPELIKTMAVKNFDNFPDHRGFVDELQDPLFGKNLFSLRGDKWRDARTLLSPAFTSSKMKTMFKLMFDYAATFADFLAQSPEDKNEIEMKDAFTRYTNDVIATCAFGLNVDSMRNPKNDFYMLGKEATTFDSLRTLKFFFIRSLPTISSYLGLKIVSNRVGKFFMNLISSTVSARDERGIVRPDLLQLMMDTRGKRGPGKELTIEDMTAQAFIFFLGGFDTVSTLMCFASHEIAVNPDVQARLQAEIDEVMKESKGEPSYEAINNMSYLDAVINEALRLYPVAVFLDRMCIKTFELPPALPGDQPFTVEKGMNVWFPVYGIQRDPKYYEEPDRFNPERFLDEGRKILNSGAYFPFGIGPRMCIGNRFALLETKALIFHLLARCDLTPCAKTGIPLKLSKSGLAMLAEGGFWMKIKARKNSVEQTSMMNGTKAS